MRGQRTLGLAIGIPSLAAVLWSLVRMWQLGHCGRTDFGMVIECGSGMGLALTALLVGGPAALIGFGLAAGPVEGSQPSPEHPADDAPSGNRASTDGEPTFAEEIDALWRLHEAGALTEEEFTAAKYQLFEGGEGRRAQRSDSTD